MNIEASVTNLHCNHEVCPQTQRVVTCTINGSYAEWYSPPSDDTAIATVTSMNVYNKPNSNFTAALVSINNTGLTTNLSFNATATKNGAQVKCVNRIYKTSMTCTILISGLSLTVLYITNM